MPLCREREGVPHIRIFRLSTEKVGGRDGGGSLSAPCYLKNGCAEGRSPFAGCVRVSLTYIFFDCLPTRWMGEMAEGVFQHPAS